jgi:hypothetical protein
LGLGLGLSGQQWGLGLGLGLAKDASAPGVRVSRLGWVRFRVRVRP